MTDLGLFYALQITSTFSVLPPIGAGLLVYYSLDKKTRAFIALLLTGFITDLCGWYFFHFGNGTANLYMRYVYNLLEAWFFFWFVGQFFHAPMKKVLLRSWFVLIPFWTFSFFHSAVFAAFKTTTEVFIAFASSFCLLRLVETEENVPAKREFWILLGVFFYCFCTFFFMGLLDSTLGLKIWYGHNIINIIANLIFLIAFTREKRSRLAQ